jgi:hypothetical protein
MPLSTPRSVESADGTIESVAVEQAFLRALRVFIGEVSRPMPRDQEKSLFKGSVVGSRQEEEGISCKSLIVDLPKKIGSGTGECKIHWRGFEEVKPILPMSCICREVGRDVVPVIIFKSVDRIGEETDGDPTLCYVAGKKKELRRWV